MEKGLQGKNLEICRIQFEAEIETSQLIAAAALTNKVLSQHSEGESGFKLDGLTVLQIYKICLLLVLKTSSDLYFTNAIYAQIFGFELETFNSLERKFLFDHFDF